MLMQNFGVTNKEHYGMLWYFLEWSIGFFTVARGLGQCCVELHYGTVLGTNFDPVSRATS